MLTKSVHEILSMHNPGTEFCRVAKEPGTTAPCFAISTPLAVIPANAGTHCHKKSERSEHNPLPQPQPGTTVPPLAIIPALNFAGWQKNWEPLPPVSPSPPH